MADEDKVKELQQKPIPPRTFVAHKVTFVYHKTQDKWHRLEHCKDQYGRRWMFTTVVDAPQLGLGEHLREEDWAWE